MSQIEKTKTLATELETLGRLARKSFELAETELRERVNFDVTIAEGEQALCYYATYTEDRHPGIFVRLQNGSWHPFQHVTRDTQIAAVMALPSLIEEINRLLEVKVEHARGVNEVSVRLAGLLETMPQ